LLLLTVSLLCDLLTFAVVINLFAGAS